MEKIGVVGARGQLGSSLIKILGPKGLALDRSALRLNSVKSMIWAAGRVSNLCTDLEAEYELNGLKSVLESADFSPVSRIVLLSSGGTVYGNHSHLPITESDALRPETAYARLKVKIEEEFKNLCMNREISLIILRIANVFSSRGKGLINLLINQKVAGNFFELYVNSHSRKQYGHSDDYASLIVRYATEIPHIQNPQTFNLYSPNSYSVEEIISIASNYLDLSGINFNLKSILPLNSIELSTKFPNFIHSHMWLTVPSFFKQELGEPMA
jgi:nucleoside-diphosphate-sugar epimerase